jgi:hypothetical protein
MEMEGHSSAEQYAGDQAGHREAEPYGPVGHYPSESGTDGPLAEPYAPDAYAAGDDGAGWQAPEDQAQDFYSADASQGWQPQPQAQHHAAHMAEEGGPPPPQATPPPPPTLEERQSRTELYHPNRKKASAQTVRGANILAALGTAGLIALLMFVTWDVSQGWQWLQIVYALAFVLCAVMIMRWSRGALAFSATLAIFLIMMALVAGGSWFNVDKAGLTQAALPNGLVGTLTFALVPIGVLLIGLAAAGMGQQWQVEAARPARDT